MTTTDNLGLHLTGTSPTELAMSFLEWRKLINGEGDNSNMKKLDAAYGVLNGKFGGIQLTIDETDNGLNISYTTE